MRSRWPAGDDDPNREPWSTRTEERNTPAGSSGTGSAKRGSSDRWAESRHPSTARSSKASGQRCNASSSTGRPGPRKRNWHRRCSSGSKRSTTPPAGTPRSATSAPWSSNDFTTPPQPRHDQQRETVREAGTRHIACAAGVSSGSSRGDAGASTRRAERWFQPSARTPATGMAIGQERRRSLRRRERRVSAFA